MAFALPSLFVLDPTDPYATPKLNLKLIFVGLGIFIAFIVVSIAFLVLSSSGDGTQSAYYRLMAQQDFLSSTISNAQTQLNNDDLIKVSADASALFTSDGLALSSLLAQFYNVSTVPSTYVTAANDTSVATQLDAATQAGDYDSTYQQIVLQKISALQSLDASLLAKLHSPALRQGLTKYAHDLQIIHDELTAIQL